MSQTASMSRQLKTDHIHGLTLLETLLALVMLSLLIVGLLGLLGSLLVSSTKSSDSSAGVYLAQYELEQAASAGSPPAPEGGLQTFERKRFNHELDHAVTFQVALDWTLLKEIPRYTPANAPDESREFQFGARLYHVKATVWWMVENPEDGRAEGGGKRTVTLERIIKVSAR